MLRGIQVLQDMDAGGALWKTEVKAGEGFKPNLELDLGEDPAGLSLHLYHRAGLFPHGLSGAAPVSSVPAQIGAVGECGGSAGSAGLEPLLSLVGT